MAPVQGDLAINLPVNALPNALLTIAVALKVQDGIILAADSAVSLTNQAGEASNVYNHGNKMINLVKGWPLGAVTWGAGSIGNSSMSTLMKDLRVRLTGELEFDVDAEAGEESPGSLTVIPSFQEREKYPEWALDQDDFGIKEVAEKLRQFLEKEHYEPLRDAVREAAAQSSEDTADPDSEEMPPVMSPVGFWVVGYSAGESHAEIYEVGFQAPGGWYGPNEVAQLDEFGVSWQGQPEWIGRLVYGVSPSGMTALVSEFGLTEEEATNVLMRMRASSEVSLWHPAMPVQDAIDLAGFLVDVTKAVSRFAPGAPTVGGETEIAAITKHEGFKWVNRKHYYTTEFNPPIW